MKKYVFTLLGIILLCVISLWTYNYFNHNILLSGTPLSKLGPNNTPPPGFAAIDVTAGAKTTAEKLKRTAQKIDIQRKYGVPAKSILQDYHDALNKGNLEEVKTYLSKNTKDFPSNFNEHKFKKGDLILVEARPATGDDNHFYAGYSIDGQPVEATFVMEDNEWKIEKLESLVTLE